MKLPKTVTMFGKPVKVRVLTKNQMKSDDLGLCMHEDQEIRIRKGIGKEQAFDTFIHECLHFIDFEMGTKLTEEQVTLIGTGIAHLLLSNPEIGKMVAGGGIEPPASGL